MSTVTVTARTVLNDNLAQGGNNCKFYRTYEIPGVGALFQWGSARQGMRGGQFQSKTNPGEARSQIAKKHSGGYEPVSPDVQFPLDLDKLNGRGGIDSAAGRSFIDNLFQAAAQSVGQTTATAAAMPTVNTSAATAASDRLDIVRTRALDAIHLASTGDTMGALQVAAEVRDEIAAVELDLLTARSYIETLDMLLVEVS